MVVRRWFTGIVGGWSAPLASALVAGMGLLMTPPLPLVAGAAQPTVRLKAATPGQTWQLPVDAVNQARGNHQLILYTPAFGTTTQTNPYGVEVVARQVDGQADVYRVEQVTSVWDCQKSNVNACGNAPLTPGTVVLSATGDRRKPLLDQLPVGTTFALEPLYFRQAAARVDVVNPNEKNNPRGRTYPGFRASHQLLLYTAAYPEPSTGTNEYGFEVTVVDGVVVAAEGANSPIPPNGYVLSGHGRMRDWLVQYAPVGARIQLDGPADAPPAVQAVTDYQTYRYQFAQLLSDTQVTQSQHSEVGAKLANLAMVLAQADQLALNQQQPEKAVALLQQHRPQLEAVYWGTFPTYPATALKAVWHRPRETTRQAIAQTLDRFQAAGLNAVLLESFYHGYPLFDSQVYRQYGLAGTQYPTFKGQDVLGWWLEEAHARGMQLHAWVQVFYAGNRSVEGVGPILAHYPQWANVQYSALNATGPTPSTLELGHYFLDPANPDVQTFLLKVFDELVTRYPALDGLQLDYIRYPASFPPDRYSYLQTTWGYTPYARQQFLQATGTDPATLAPQHPLWLQWQAYKTQQVTTFVGQVAQQLQQHNQKQRHRVALSAAIFPDPAEARLLKHQDWANWSRAGWVDFLASMSLTGSVEKVRANVQHLQQGTAGTRTQAVSGVFSPFNNLPPRRMLEQLTASQQAGAAGYALFDSAHLGGDLQQALRIWQTNARLLAMPLQHSQPSSQHPPAGMPRGETQTE